MTAPAKQPNYDHDPSSCSLCQRHAIGLGVQEPRGPINWLCAECSLSADIARDIIKDKRRFDAYENKALDMADEMAGEFVVSQGWPTDIAEMDELQRRLLWRSVVQGFGDSIRKLIRNGRAPF